MCRIQILKQDILLLPKKALFDKYVSVTYHVVLKNTYSNKIQYSKIFFIFSCEEVDSMYRKKLFFR